MAFFNKPMYNLALFAHCVLSSKILGVVPTWLQNLRTCLLVCSPEGSTTRYIGTPTSLQNKCNASLKSDFNS